MIRHGVPQGSILGPVLFLVYVNDIGSHISNGHIVQYADDTTLCFSAESIPALEIQAFVNLNLCIQQFERTQLSVNSSKTKYIHFSLRNHDHTLKPLVMVDDIILQETNSVKFLGVHLDRGLSWGDHIDSVGA